MAHYYPVTITEIRKFIRSGNRIRNEDEDHLRWMCSEIDKLDPCSVTDALKAARWIGWILAQIEGAGYWQNDRSRDLLRADVLHGKDRPVWTPPISEKLFA